MARAFGRAPTAGPVWGVRVTLHAPMIGPACPGSVNALALALYGRWTVDFERLGLAIVDEARIWLPGRPVPKGRPRAWKSRLVTPPATRKFEGAVAMACSRVDLVPPRGEEIVVAAHVSAVFKRTGWEDTKKRRELVVKSRLRADLDNVVKSVLDGAQRSHLIEDDSHVVAVNAWRMVAPFEAPKLEGVILSLAWCSVVDR